MNLITQQMSPLDANGNTSLRAVVEYGNANAQNGDWNTNHYNVDFLRVAGGTITLTQNTTLALNTNFNFFNGAITVERSSAPNTPAFNHFDIIADTESHFVSMTLTNGKSGVSGGSIYNSGTIQFMSCTFMNNASAGSGGAIYTRSGATATLSSCTFTDNSADDNGGAVAADADSLATSFANCTITGNSAKMHGGAIASEVPHGPWTRG
jgi:predicted outer membrane repeat protein